MGYWGDTWSLMKLTSYNWCETLGVQNNEMWMNVPVCKRISILAHIHTFNSLSYGSVKKVNQFLKTGWLNLMIYHKQEVKVTHLVVVDKDCMITLWRGK